MVHFLRKVGNRFAKWEGGALDLRAGTCSSFWIAKLIESSA